MTGRPYLLQLILALLQIEVPSDHRVFTCKLYNFTTVKVVK